MNPSPLPPSIHTHFQKDLQPAVWKQELPTTPIMDPEDEIDALKEELTTLRSLIAEVFDLDHPPTTIAEIRSVLERNAVSGVHTCHPDCNRPTCVLRRERDAERQLADRLGETLKDLCDAPDDRSIDEIEPEQLKAWGEAYGAIETWKDARKK